MRHFRTFLIAALAVFAFNAPVFAQVAGDKRINSTTQRPEIYDGSRWSTDWNVLSSDGVFLGIANNQAEYDAFEPNGVNDWMRVDTAFTLSGLIPLEVPAGYYYWAPGWTELQFDAEAQPTEINVVSTATGYYRVSEDRPASPVAMSTGALSATQGTLFSTGHDFTTDGATLKISFADVTGPGRSWPIAEIDLSAIPTTGTAANEFYVWNHDNSFIRCLVTDYTVGDFRCAYATRAVNYVASELWIVAPEVLSPRLEVQQFGGRFLLDPNEFTGFSLAGAFDDTITNDLGNVGAAPTRVAGGFSFPFDVQLKEMSAKHYNSNATVLPWGFRVITQEKGVGNAVVNLDVIRECVGDGADAICPQDHLSTVNVATTLDLSASEVVPAGAVIGIGVEAATAIATNYYVNVMSGYISYERVN